MNTSHHAGARLPIADQWSTVLPDLDFETYSEAGYLWRSATAKWVTLPGAQKKGIFAVGAAAYASHPSTEVLSLAYNLKDGAGSHLWLPDMPPPADLFDHIRRGLLLEAWNCAFEWWVWRQVCQRKLDWPELPFWLLRDAPAKARAFGYPGALAKAGEATRVLTQKNADGKRLLQKFSVPRNPTKANPALRILPADDPADAYKLYRYNLDDIAAESAVSAVCPDLPPEEQEFELWTRAMNVRGVAIDVETAEAGAAILTEALEGFNQRISALTGQLVQKTSEVKKLTDWLAAQSIFTGSLDEASVQMLLDRPDLPAPAREALELRQLAGYASVKKLYTILRQLVDGRLHDLFIYHGARIGRDTGAAVQPQNLPTVGPDLYWCGSCEQPYGQHLEACPHCRQPASHAEARGWDADAVDHAVAAIRTRSLPWVEHVFGNALLTLSGCLRGLFIAAPGHDFLCSDYSSIEAVVTAMLANEPWRIEAFHQRKDIYLVSAGRITGTNPEQYQQYKAETGHHHPDRQKIGKPAELGLGFGGWVNAWYQFDKSGTFTENEVKQNILAWRAASPWIVELWGGQVRGKPWDPERYELFGLEGAAIAAVTHPGERFTYGLISYIMQDDTLYCRLPSGRSLAYQRPRLSVSSRWEGQQSLSYESWNSNPKMGPLGWVRLETYGGRLTENAVQATARDVMRDAVSRLEKAGYPIVLRVHDELVAEVPEGTGDLAQFEELMGQTPAWAEGWPVRASGGWRGKRYRKD